MGKAAGAPGRPAQLLGIPLAFTQNALLTPEEFTSRARDLGVGLRLQHLAELHRRGALVPLLRILQRPSKASPPVPVAVTAANGCGQYRSPIALVTAAASGGLLVNPGAIQSAAVVSGCASLAQALARPRGSHRPEHAMANGFANETRRYGRDGAKRRRCSPSRPPGQRDALRRQRHRRRTSYGSSPSDQRSLRRAILQTDVI